MEANMDDQNNKPTQPVTPPPAPVVPEVEREPSVVPTPQFASMDAPVAPPPAPKRKKGKLIAIIVAVVVALLGVGTVLAYFLWYQNPDKVVTDGILNAMQAKTATYTATIDSNDESKMRLIVAGKANEAAMSADLDFTMTSGGKNVAVKGGAVVEFKGDMYVKVANASELVTTFLDGALGGGASAEVAQPINDFASKINDKWIKISAEDTKSLSQETSETQKCTQDAMAKFQQDKAMTAEIGRLYEKNRFITIVKDLGEQNGSKGYELKEDNAKLKAFVLGLKDTQIYKDLNACDKSIVIDEKDLSSLDKSEEATTTTELWVNTWTHQITKLSVKSNEADNKSTMVVEPVFNQTVSIDIPRDTKSVNDVMVEFQKMQEAVMSQLYGTSMTGMPQSQISEL